MARFLARGKTPNFFAVFRPSSASLPHVLHVHHDETAYYCRLPRRSFSSIPVEKKSTPFGQSAAAASLVGPGAIDHLLSLPNRLDIVKRIHQMRDERVMIPYAEFSSWCLNLGLNDAESEELATALHKTGTLLQLTSDTGKRLLYLRPESLITAVMSQVDPEGVLVEAKKSELSELRTELTKLDSVLGELKTKSVRSANLKMWGFFGYLTTQTAVLARLTWWEFSWDIMEPITYFITMSSAWFGLLYVNITKSEYSHESLHSRMVNSKLSKLMQQLNIPKERREELASRIKELEIYLHDRGHINNMLYDSARPAAKADAAAAPPASEKEGGSSPSPSS